MTIDMTLTAIPRCRHSADVECVFCKIVAGELPSTRVLENEHVLAFMDINPATEGHLLVVPKRHAVGLADLPSEDGGHMMAVAQRLAQGLRRSSIRVDGVNLLLADGAAAGQEVFHCHLHVIPRTAGDRFVVSAEFRSPDRSHLEALAATIRTGLVV